MTIVSCSREYSCEDCNEKNKAPFAVAGDDKFVVLPADSSFVDGSASFDPDGKIEFWNWKKISGPSCVIKDSLSALAKVSLLTEGVFLFELKVTDNDGFSSRDTISVTVTKNNIPNRPPVARAGADTTITLPISSTGLDGSSTTDPDNNIIGYAWRRISGPEPHRFLNPIGSKTLVENLTEGVYLFELTATDAGGLFSTDTVQITVKSSPNKSPVANAGSVIAISYNLQNCSIEPSSITLDGRMSKDLDGTIVSYEWSLVFAENYSAIITSPFAGFTTVSNLSPGTYSFRLKVTDNSGASDDDTVVVNTVYSNRQEIHAKLVPVGILSTERKVSVVVALNNKIFFAGGQKKPTGPGPHFSNDVDIYDITANTWSTAKLSEAKYGMTASAIGNKVFFAGGTAMKSLPSVGVTSRIDVYNATTDLWSTMEMPHSDALLSSIVLGNKLFIAGGNYVDIYDNMTDRWATKNLSRSRYRISTMNVRGKLYFAGGETSKASGVPTANIDIYDPVSTSWSVSSLSKPKFGMGSFFLNGNAVWAGGTTTDKMTNEVEMFNPLSGNTSFSCLFQPNSFSAYSTASMNGKVIFFIGDGKAKNKFDIYDPLNDTWQIGVLEHTLTEPLVIGVNNSVFVVGSSASGNQYHQEVWKLEF
ncbi:MAG: kelch repeat-containing protein [Lacibacter sp.]